MKKQNAVTPFIRQCVKLWLSGNDNKGFTVTDICVSLYQQHQSLIDVDLVKAVSNELLRLESIGAIYCDSLEAQPIGRPLKHYKQKWCLHTLGVLRRHAETSMVKLKEGAARVFVRGDGYTLIFPGYKLHRLESVKNLIDLHKSQIKA